jgi:hypothetical protein
VKQSVLVKEEQFLGNRWLGWRLVVFLFIPFLLLACTPTQKKPTLNSKPPKSFKGSKETTTKPDLTMRSHMIKAKEQKLLLKQVVEDLNLITQTTDQTTLAQALTGAALKQTLTQLQQERLAGKPKVRRYANIKVSFANYTKGVAGLTVTFTDKSYYVDPKTGRPLTKPSNKPVKILVAVKKEANRWKIFNLLK